MGTHALTTASAIFRSSADASTSAGITAIVKVFERTRTVGAGANASIVVLGTGVRTGLGAADGALVTNTDGFAPAVSDAAATAVLLGNVVCGVEVHPAVMIVSVIATMRRLRTRASYKS
jgi:hypothetical protein